MHPQLFGMKPFPILLATAAVVGMAAHGLLVRRFDLHRPAAYGYYFTVCVGAILGARVFAIALRGGVGADIDGGFRYPGAVIGVAALLPIAAVRFGEALPVTRWLDVFVPGGAFAISILRVDCLLSGCCGGGVCSLPWAIRFPKGSPVWSQQTLEGLIAPSAGSSLAVHPLQIYFLISSALLGALALWLLPRKRFDGQVVLLFLLLHEAIKALLERLRVPLIPELQRASVGVAVGAGLLLIVLWIRSRRTWSRAVAR